MAKSALGRPGLSTAGTRGSLGAVWRPFGPTTRLVRPESQGTLRSSLRVMRRAHSSTQITAAEEDLLARLPEGTLMQRAAAGLSQGVADLIGRVYGSRVLLLVGAGNNGGDALYAGARLARRGALVDAVLLNPDRAHPAGLEAYRAAGGQVVEAP